MVSAVFCACASSALASANATLLQVHGANSLDQHMAFDDFSVVQSAQTLAPPAPALAVTEPGAYGLVLAALGALAFMRRRP